MKFLKKVETPNNASDGSKLQCDGNGSQGSASKLECREKDPYSMEIENKNENMEDITRKDSMKKASSGDTSLNDILTLSFPSISTSDFQFDHGKASDTIVESVADFLSKVDNVRLVLVDISPNSHILSLVKAKAGKKNIDPSRFFTFVGDTTRLHTEGNQKCAIIANDANWMFNQLGGGGVNAVIFKAAGEALESATKEKTDTLNPGSSVTVPLPSTPLYRREGVTHIIHVLGPNMNPQRSNCLKNDYIKGCKVLHDAYASLFENFASIARGQKCSKERNDNSTHESTDRIDIVTEGGSNFHSLSDQKNK